jgi:hypothetical protein
MNNDSDSRQYPHVKAKRLDGRADPVAALLGATLRETLLYEVALEAAFGVPYSILLSQARQPRACREVDLLCLGAQLIKDFARLARGEISSIHVPRRLPHPGEHLPER